MIWLGYGLCALLSFASLVTAAGLAKRLDARPGAEFLLATAVCWFAIVLAPIHLLGIGNHLSRAPLALANVVACVLVTMACSRGRTLPRHLHETLDACRRSFDRARAAGTAAWGAGPLAAGAIAALVVAVAWTAILTYLLPSDGWDAIWYHDLMVGYAIQQHGYAHIELPRALIQQANGYPRNCEMTSLWFVIFADRKLLELPSVLSAVVLALATYCLCRRHGRADGIVATLLAIALVLLPGARLEMRTTYVDIQFAASTLAAYYFASAPDMTPRAALLASIALGIALGTKGQALLAVPLLSVLALGLLAWNEGRAGWRSILGVTATGIFVIVWLGAPTYALNWVRHHNPFWPIAMRLGPFSFDGIIPYATLDESHRFDVVANLFDVPRAGKDFADTQLTGYGLFGYCILPFAAIGAVLALVEPVRLAWRGLFERPAQAELRRAVSLAVVTIVAAIGLAKSTALWSARYNLPAVGVALVLVAWLSSRFGRRHALGLGAASCALLTNIAMWSWSDPGWGPKGIVAGPSDVLALFAKPARDRAGMSPVHDPDMVRARDRELGPGDLVVWTASCVFPSLLWNERFSNVLVFRPDTVPPGDLLDEAERMNAKWIVVTGATADAARSRSDRWQRVGLTHRNHSPSDIFRRIP